MTTDSSFEDIPANVHGMITSVGLPRLLGAIWNYDIHDPQKLDLMKIRLGAAVDERDGLIRLPIASYLIIERTDSRVTIDGKSRSQFRVQGELEQAYLDKVMACSIEDHWQTLEDDELEAFLTLDIRESQAPHVSIRPSPPPSRHE